LASQPKVENQAAMVSLGRPGAGEALLLDKGFAEIARDDITCIWEFPDPATYARTLASTGPAYEAIQSVGEEEFLRVAEDGARRQVREGLPLRAPIAIVGYTARKPLPMPKEPPSGGDARERVGFLQMPKVSEAAQRLFDEDVDVYGFVMNASRLWAYAPDVLTRLFDLLGSVTKLGSLSVRQRGILVAATASTRGDSYCSLAWGSKLASESSAAVAADVLRGVDNGLDDAEKVLAAWARRVVSDPNAVTNDDVGELRRAGFTDTQIFAITVYVAGRLAFSTVNDALGAQPDSDLLAHTAREIRDAVTFGRPAEG
jgi:alkylhydroperoxidase family enzyme